MAQVKKIQWVGNQEDEWVEATFGGVTIESNQYKVKMGDQVQFTVYGAGGYLGEFNEFYLAELFANAYFADQVSKLVVNVGVRIQ